jgi:hypothetical protein
MGSGGGGQDNGPMFQIMQAQQAREEENMRQQRLTQGRNLIDRQFQGLEKDPTFFNRYKQAVTDYYKPQITRQYADANKELTYRLADAGTLRSSAANDATADLNLQNDMNIAGMNAKADSAAADLRQRVASEKDSAINQLYATEDPSVASNTALNSIANIGVAKPDLSPLANLFNVATVGAANAMKSWQTAGVNSYAGGGGSPSPTSPSLNSNSGRNVFN